MEGTTALQNSRESAYYFKLVLNFPWVNTLHVCNTPFISFPFMRCEPPDSTGSFKRASAQLAPEMIFHKKNIAFRKLDSFTDKEEKLGNDIFTFKHKFAYM